MKQGRRGFKRSSYAAHMASDLHALWMLQPKGKPKAPKLAGRKGSRSRGGQESSRSGEGEGEQEEEEEKEGKVVVAVLAEGTQVFESGAEGELMEARSIEASLPELSRRAQQAAAAAGARARLKQLSAKRRRAEDGDHGGGGEGEGESGESSNQKRREDKAGENGVSIKNYVCRSCLLSCPSQPDAARSRSARTSSA